MRIKIFENEIKEDFVYPELVDYGDILYSPESLEDINKEQGDQFAQNITDISGNTADIVINASGIAVNVTDISGNATNITINASGISTNVTDISGNATDIAINASGIAVNITDISGNATNITANASGIAVNVSDISGNTTNISVNASGISANVSDISSNALGISANVSNISINASGISTNVSNITIAQSTADSKAKVFYQTAIPTSVTIGDLWFDTDNKNKVYRAASVGADEIIAGEWEEARDTDIVFNTTNITQNATDISLNATSISNNAGDITTNSSNITINADGISSNATNITTAQSTADSKVKTFIQTTAPTAETTGDLWFDSDDGYKMYRWSGTAWVEIQDTDIGQAITNAATAQSAADSAQVDATQAISDAAGAQGTADGKVTTFYQTTSPTAEGIGDLWIDTDDGNKLYRWSGSAWVEVQDDDIAQAIANAATAQNTADSKIVTFYQAGIPVATDAGDLWVDTDNGNRMYRATNAGDDQIIAGEWVEIQDTAIATAQATADGKVVTFYQDAEPVAEGVGDLWVDTNDTNKLYRWSGSAWVSVVDSDIAQAISDAAGAQSTADGKIVTFYQTTPPTAEGVGDIWFDTDDKNKQYRWGGAAWVEVRDADIEVNTTNITQNATDISLNATSISGNAGNITTNSSNISINASGISSNVSSISSNAGGISTNQTNISQNATDISLNATDISGNTSDITINANGISANVTDISGNSSSISTNATNINLRVQKNDVINQINISTEGIRIAGENITLDGDVNVTGAFSVSGNVISGGTVSGTNILVATSAYSATGKLRWTNGGKVWEDTSSYMGITSMGGRIYFYTSNTSLYALFQAGAQASFYTGISCRGPLNVTTGNNARFANNVYFGAASTEYIWGGSNHLDLAANSYVYVNITGTQKLKVSSQGVSISNGLLYIPAMTGAQASGYVSQNGAMYYKTDTNQLRMYGNGSWQTIHTF